LILSLVAFFYSSYSLPVHATTIDGFVANCTSNQDGTGVCVNQENLQSFSCIIIPGQVIDCLSSRGKDFQCVAISNTIGDQAQFSCDAKVDNMLAGELNDKILRTNQVNVLNSNILTLPGYTPESDSTNIKAVDLLEYIDLSGGKDDLLQNSTSKPKQE